MTISRGQMNRQLRMGGGIMDVVPREPAILGGIKKAVKKVGKTIGKVAKSPIGKAALLGAAAYYAPGIGIKAQFGPGISGLKAAGLAAKSRLGDFFVGSPLTEGIGRGSFSTSGLGKILGMGGAGKGMGSLGKLATLGAVSTFLTKQFGMSPEQAEETLANPESRALYLRRYYQNLNPNAGDEEVEEFVSANVAEYMADGGRIMKAAGDTASMNAMQAAGIEGLPIRQNPKGVKELDLRDTGGFIPPVGIKEKEDDIPAMLSNNEFVMTADAVRGMGGGNVELGAQRMYDQMKMLEAGGKV